MIKIVVCILCSVLGVIGSPPLGAVTPPFSYMTLSGTSRIALTVEDIDRDFAIYGLNSEQVVERVTAALTAGGITVVPYASALTEQQTALLRVRIMTNHDAHGFYHLSVKLELRQKIPLGNAASGFVSQAVWTDARNGIVQASEIDKIAALVDELIAVFIVEHRAQNSHASP